MKFDNYINYVLNENKLSGGLADGHTVESIAKKHNVSINKIRHQLNIGTTVEMEHTKDERIAAEIALDHLYEIEDYYTRLEKMERAANVKEEMVSADVVGDSGYSGGVAPQDNIPYAKGDARVPKLLFGKKKKRGKNNKPAINIQRRPKAGM